MRKHPIFSLAAVALVAPAFLACAQTQQVADRQPVAQVTSERMRIEVDVLDDDPIYFGFDDQVLDDASLSRLDAIAAYMEHAPDTEVTITGHADERGTFEYNLALGDRRGRAARDYLVRLGVDPDRVFVVSYGEEQPAVEGEDENAHALNRRDEFLFFTRLTQTAGR